jgi:hypothetical protein
LIALLLCLFSSCLTWQAGKENAYALGDVMNLNGSCYVSQGAVNGWITPGTNSFFWQSVDCATSCASNDSIPAQSNSDSLLTVAAGQIATSQAFWAIILIGFAFGVALAAKSLAVRAVIELVDSGDKEDSYN